MNNELGITKVAEYTSNQAIIKSQKILNSASNFHMKTEHQERGDQDQKSPENHKIELRESWRKPRMHMNRLPEAFQYNKQKKKKNNKEMLENIDKIVKENQAKEVQKYLDPIKLQKKSEEKSKQTSENGNPLIVFPKFMKIKNQFNKNMKEMQDMSMNKFKTLSTKQSKPSLKISDCITLDVIKRGHITGTIKKMLHVPTLKLLCIRQEPLNTKESRHAIKEWVQFWQTKLNYPDNQRFINVYSTFFNYPEGAVSIVTEYFKRGSLLNLLNIVITLPESVIRQIFTQILQSLQVYYDCTEMHFGGLSPSQIMFTESGRIKLGMGLYYHFPNTNSNNVYHLKSVQKVNIFDFNSTQNKFMKNSIEKPLNLELQRSYDIFKIGLIILECAVGGFQNFEQSAVLHENIKTAFTEDGQRQIQRDNVCCLIHSETYLLEFIGFQQEGSRRDKFQVGKVIQYMKFLKDRFSMQFINFLCICLKLSHSRRATLKDLMSHSFLRNDNNKESKTVKVDLADLLEISCEWNLENYMESGKQEKMDKFIGHIMHVLNDCRKQVLIDLITNEKDKILNLAKHIEVNYLNLGERLYEAIFQLIKTDKPNFNTSI